jgi:hypothetical protein
MTLSYALVYYDYKIDTISNVLRLPLLCTVL